MDQPGRAQRLLEVPASDRVPGSNELLSRALLEGGPDGPVLAEHRALVCGHLGDPAAALECLAVAEQVDGLSARGQRERVNAALAMHDFDLADQLAEHCRSESDAARALVRQARAEANGTNDGLVTALFQRHVRTHPFDDVSRRHLVHLLLRDREFAAARAVAGDGPQAILTEWAALTARGDHAAAHQAKKAFARTRRRPGRTTSALAHIDYMCALNYSYDADTTLSALERTWPPMATSLERQIRAKVRSDLRLTQGDTDMHQALRLRYEQPNVQAEHTFANAVRGSRLLVVGPSPVNQPTPHQIDTADLVISTQDIPALSYERPQVVYVADPTARRAAATYRHSLDTHPHTIVVLRPSMIGRIPGQLADHERCRVMQAEDSTPYLSTHFAVSRIIYDVLAYRPRSVTLTGVDFFIGKTHYQPGYASPVAVPFNFSHDYAYAFRYVQRLVRCGLVGVDGSLARLLELDLPDYLASLTVRP
ncbi:MAG: hypothetical protein AAGA42_01115 [Actinomycetota bacterium]